MTDFERSNLTDEEMELLLKFLNEIDPENKLFDLTKDIISEKMGDDKISKK